MAKPDLSEYLALTCSNIQVPNSFPNEPIKPTYRIAFVGEAPGEEEEKQKKPFVGAAGRFLTHLCIDAGIDRRECFLGNICQIRPPKNDLDLFDWNGNQIQTGLAQLKQDLQIFRPNLVVLLGSAALRAAKGLTIDAKGKPKPFSVGDWRGSLFRCEDPSSPLFNHKCMATYHPAGLFRNYSAVPLTRFDLKRARKEGDTPALDLPKVSVDTAPVASTIIGRLRAIRSRKLPVTFDIEGGCGTMSCLSISVTPNEAFIIPFSGGETGNYWSEGEEVQIWQELSALFADPEIPKTLQNSMYDRFVLAYSYRCLVRGVKDDTMLKAWELFCEFDKDLGTLTSLYTRHPFYKDQRKADNQVDFWSYCCQDSAITNTINTVQSKSLTGSSLEHYRFNINLLDPFLFIELKGMRVDRAKRDKKIDELQSLAYFDNKAKESGGVEQLKLEAMVGWKINIRSNHDTQKLLYDQLKLPLKLKTRASGERTPTGDFETLLHFGKQYGHPVLLQAIKVRRILKHTSDLVACTTDQYGRIRSSINVVGTVTGRTSSSEAPTGYGTALQTIREEDRDIFIADPDHDFCQCDLAGADGWTVAAHCAKLGDATMLEDYLSGLKPAKLIALLYLHGESINTMDRPTLKHLSRNINADTDRTNNYLYYACKRVQHGTNYLMGDELLSRQIYLDTDGEADIPVSQARELQRLYKSRYKGIAAWHEWLENVVLKKQGFIKCASGHVRFFFGRKDDHATLGEACAEEPQHNTTYVTNLALLRLWNDTENRVNNGTLRIWPCHHIHDALCAQWHVSLRQWAINRMHSFFDNPIYIAGQRILIPFEGRFGPSWGEQTNDI